MTAPDPWGKVHLHSSLWGGLQEAPSSLETSPPTTGFLVTTPRLHLGDSGAGWEGQTGDPVSISLRTLSRPVFINVALRVHVWMPLGERSLLAHDKRKDGVWSSLWTPLVGDLDCVLVEQLSRR